MITFAVACALAAASGCATLGAGGSSGATAVEMGNVRVGAPMPDLTVRTLKGDRAISLSSLRGQVVLLDIWASWCPPCKDELPLLDDLAARLAARGILVLAVSVDEESANAEAFLRTRPRWSLTVAHDPAGAIADTLAPPKMPTSYLIDRNGILRHVSAGFEPGDEARLEARLVDLAAAR
jgi:thiol-disulfide isomerase/thioredoxin